MFEPAHRRKNVEWPRRINCRPTISAVTADPASQHIIQPIQQECLIVVYLHIRPKCSARKSHPARYVQQTTLLRVDFYKGLLTICHRGPSSRIDQRDVFKEI